MGVNHVICDGSSGPQPHKQIAFYVEDHEATLYLNNDYMKAQDCPVCSLRRDVDTTLVSPPAPESVDLSSIVQTLMHGGSYGMADGTLLSLPKGLTELSTAVMTQQTMLQTEHETLNTKFERDVVGQVNKLLDTMKDVLMRLEEVEDEQINGQ